MVLSLNHSWHGLLQIESRLWSPTVSDHLVTKFRLATTFPWHWHVSCHSDPDNVRCQMSHVQVSLVSIAWERPIRGWSAVLATIRKWWETASDLDNGSRRIMSFLNWSSFIVWKFEWPFYTIDFFWSFIFEMCVSCKCWNHIHSLSKAPRNQNLSGSLI